MPRSTSAYTAQTWALILDRLAKYAATGTPQPLFPAAQYLGDAVDVRPTVLVRWPRAEIAAFMFDPANDLRWTGGITSSRPPSQAAS